MYDDIVQQRTVHDDVRDCGKPEKNASLLPFTPFAENPNSSAAFTIP
jgi:hypothetical protein